MHKRCKKLFSGKLVSYPENISLRLCAISLIIHTQFNPFLLNSKGQITDSVMIGFYYCLLSFNLFSEENHNDSDMIPQLCIIR